MVGLSPKSSWHANLCLKAKTCSFTQKQCTWWQFLECRLLWNEGFSKKKLYKKVHIRRGGIQSKTQMYTIVDTEVDTKMDTEVDSSFWNIVNVVFLKCRSCHFFWNIVHVVFFEMSFMSSFLKCRSCLFWNVVHVVLKCRSSHLFVVHVCRLCRR